MTEQRPKKLTHQVRDAMHLRNCTIRTEDDRVKAPSPCHARSQLAPDFVEVGSEGVGIGHALPPLTGKRDTA